MHPSAPLLELSCYLLESMDSFECASIIGCWTKEQNECSFPKIDFLTLHQLKGEVLILKIRLTWIPWNNVKNIKILNITF